MPHRFRLNTSGSEYSRAWPTPKSNCQYLWIKTFRYFDLKSDGGWVSYCACEERPTFKTRGLCSIDPMALPTSNSKWIGSSGRSVSGTNLSFMTRKPVRSMATTASMEEF
jgi:hypothetical protein